MFVVDFLTSRKAGLGRLIPLRLLVEAPPQSEALPEQKNLSQVPLHFNNDGEKIDFVQLLHIIPPTQK